MDLYFQGLVWYNKGVTREFLTRARDYFERALALDPDNVDAFIGTAQVDAALGATQLTDDPIKALAAAEVALTKALLQQKSTVCREKQGRPQFITSFRPYAIAYLGMSTEPLLSAALRQSNSGVVAAIADEHSRHVSPDRFRDRIPHVVRDCE